MAALSAMFIGSTFAARIATKVGCERRAILGAFMFIGLWLAVSGMVPIFAISLPAFMLHEVGRGIFDPVKDKYLNAHIPSDKRATLDSLQSTTRHMGSITGLLASGLIATHYSDGISWCIAGAVLIIGAILLNMRINMRTQERTS